MHLRFSPRTAVPGLVLGLLLALPPSPPWLSGGEWTKSNPRVFAAFRDVVAKPSHSVVQILSGGKAVALGTVVGEDGWILTKNSLLEDRDVTVKLSGGKTHPARISGVQDEYDLALLKIDAKGLKPIEWKPSNGASVGDWVATVGTGSEPLAVGVVSVPVRKMRTRDYRASANPRSGFLGINVAEAEKGVKVSGVQEDTAAAKAGIKPGDIILAINGKSVNDPQALINVIGRYKPDDKVSLQVLRGDKEEKLQVTLGKRPASGVSRGDVQNNMGSKLSERKIGFPAILQHDTVVKPEDCGGPLVELDGKAVGINIARAGRVESYAIPSENVLALIDEMKTGKYALKSKETGGAEVKKLEEAIKSAAAKLAEVQKKYDRAAKLLKQAEEAATVDGKNEPALLEIKKSAAEVVSRAETELASLRKTLESLTAELQKVKEQK